MTSLLKTNNKVLRNKYKLIAEKNEMHNQTMHMLNKLTMRSNITVKKKIVLKNIKNAIPIKVPTKITEHQKPTKILENLKTAKVLENSNTGQISEDQNTEKINNNVENQNTVKISKNEEEKRTFVRKRVRPTKGLLIPKEKEYYPEKVKRKTGTKKVVLQPKHEYRVIATTNKRKRTIPVKEVESPLPEQTTQTELTLAELVRVAEEQGLDDEDFMEILTCPSPVWWEEHSDEEDIRFRLDEYMEDDATIQQKNKLIQEIDDKATNEANNYQIKDNSTKSNKDNMSFFKKLVAKRTKLENLLNNIRSKNLTPGDDNEMNKVDDMENKDEIKVVNEINSDSKNKHRKDSVSELSDVSINEDLISTLENIKIPVKETKNNPNANTQNVIIENKIPRKRKKITEKEVKVVNNNQINRKRTRKPNKKYEFEWEQETKRRVKVKNETYNEIENPKAVNTKTTAKKDETNNELIKPKTVHTINKAKEKTSSDVIKNLYMNVPLDLPPLTKNPFKNKNKPRVYASPKSMENLTQANLEVDSISDTNIKFLDEYDNKEEPEESVNVNKYGEGADGELVTVYQIVSNKTDNYEDIESQIKVNLVNKPHQTEIVKNNGQINAFYRTRKTTHRKSKYNKTA